jgi:hypothetical protein
MFTILTGEEGDVLFNKNRNESAGMEINGRPVATASKISAGRSNITLRSSSW